MGTVAILAQGLCVRVTMAAKKAGKKKVAKKKIAKKKKGKKKAAKKPTKKRRKAKAKPISKRAARSRVWRGKLGKSKGGLTKAALTKNKHGKIVSRKASARAGKNKWIAAVVKARKELKLKGFVACKKGTAFYKGLDFPTTNAPEAAGAGDAQAAEPATEESAEDKGFEAERDCVDTEGWASGMPITNEDVLNQLINAEIRTHDAGNLGVKFYQGNSAQTGNATGVGLTCAGYAFLGICVNKHIIDPTAPNSPCVEDAKLAGEAHNSPENNCCACGMAKKSSKICSAEVHEFVMLHRQKLLKAVMESFEGTREQQMNDGNPKAFHNADGTLRQTGGSHVAALSAVALLYAA